jgi:hypothetical protein
MSQASVRTFNKIQGTATYHAINCAITSWHISDWVWESYGVAERQGLIGRFNSDFDVESDKALERFQKLLRERHRPLHICWQIATGSKHKNIKKADPLIAVQELRVNQSQAGLMQAGQPLGLRRQRLVVHDGTKKVLAEKLFGMTADIWDRELRSWGFLEDRLISAD